MKPRMDEPLLLALQVWPCLIAFGFTVPLLAEVFQAIR